MSEIVQVVLEQGKAHARTEAQWKYNKEQKLQISGVDLPEHFEAHFSNSVNGKSKTMIGQNGLVEIPSEYFNTGTEIYCWIYVQEGSASVTKYEIVIPIRQRAEITDEKPTLQQESVVEQAISALNSGVTRTEAAAQEAKRIECELPGTIEAALQEAKESGEFDGKDGAPGADGKTPEYGVDYGTPEQISGIANQAAEILQPDVNQIKKDIADKLDYKNPQELTADQQSAIQLAIGILSVEEVLF